MKIKVTRYSPVDSNDYSYSENVDIIPTIIGVLLKNR